MLRFQVFSAFRFSVVSALLAVVSQGFPLSEAAAEEVPDQPEELAQLSIEELINLEVTSPSKKPERFSDVASALFVLTQDDIRRSGATSIPEVLRLVPGLTVARIDGSQWAISARGFTGVFGDKLLVLIDGRSVYTPLFGGVFWNEQDTFLQDIERIEVIRGPGATLYGANAVNGVINIITKNAKDTHGTLISTGTGNIERYFADLRYGDEVGDTHYRMYAKYFNRDENELEAGGDAHDTWEGVRGGFRTDTVMDPSNTLTVQGDAYYSESGWDFLEPTLAGGQVGRPEVKYINGANVLARWNHQISSDSNLYVQSYYDHIGRDDQVLEQRRDTFDIEFQHRFRAWDWNEFIYGAEYRIYTDDIDGSETVDVDPGSRTLDLYTAYIQDEVSLVRDHLRVILGAKVEHNDLSGFEVLPNFRMVATPNNKHTFWGAVSRAVRSPARFNQDGRIVLSTFPGEPGLPPNVVTLNGVDSYDSEYLWAYELGYRTQLASNLSFDLATFYNNYDDLISAEPAGTPFLNMADGMPFVEIPLQVENRIEGNTYGGEVVIDWRPVKSWRLVGSYSYINIDLERTKGSLDTIYSAGENQYPESQATLRSLLSLPGGVEFDTALRYVDSIATFDIESYLELDARLAWRPNRQWEFALIGRNLLHDDHLEFTSNLVDTARTEIARSYYGRVTYRF